MAPTETVVERQTSEIINYLFEEEVDNDCRLLSAGLEHDGPTGGNDDFDPVVIAEKLRSVADALNEEINFKAALNDLKKAAAQEAAEAAFSHGVEAFCESHVSQQAEVSVEIQLIKGSVAFGMYVIKSSPELKNKVKSAMTAFLNRRVGTWLTAQGGWGKLSI